MICDICGKQKATVHLTEIINDQMTKLNLCEYCAKKKGSQMEQHFGIADLLQGLADYGDKTTTPTIQKKYKCTGCGMTYEDFKKVGRLGCAVCYESFEEHLTPLLKRIHSSSHHTGKTPSSKALPKKKKKAVKTKDQEQAELIAEYEALKLQLKKAVSNERYEDAAVLRDKIKTAEARIKEI